MGSDIMWNTDKIEEQDWRERDLKGTEWKSEGIIMAKTNIKNRTKELLSNRNWTFGQLQSMGSIVDEFTEAIYSELEPKQKMDLIWDTDIEPYFSAQRPFGELMQMMVKYSISETIAIYLKDELLNANVNFNGDDKNEIPKGSLGRKSHQRLKANTKKTSEE